MVLSHQRHAFFRFSTHTTCEEHPNTGRVRLSDFYAMALHGGVLDRNSFGCRHWLVDEFFGVPATRTLFGLDCTCQKWFDSHLNCISWSMTLSEMLRLRGQILRPITDVGHISQWMWCYPSSPMPKKMALFYPLLQLYHARIVVTSRWK